MGDHSAYPEALATEQNLPDRTAHVDIVTAADHNAQSGFIRDITKTLGINPHGLYADIAARFSTLDTKLGAYPEGNFDNLSDRLDYVENVVFNPNYPPTYRLVGKNGQPYYSIQSAINSITDASASKQYIVYILPGIYPESVTLKNYVHLIGVNSNPQSAVNNYAKGVVIKPNSSSPILIGAGSHYFFSNIHFESANAHLMNIGANYSSGVTLHFNNCTLQCPSASYYLILPSLLNNLRFVNSYVSAYSVSSYLLNTNIADDALIDFTAINCFLLGHLKVQAYSEGGIALTLKNSYQYGQVISTGGMNNLSLILSKIAPAGGNAISLDCRTESNIYMGYSQLKAQAGFYPIVRSVGTELIQLNAHHSIFYPNLGAGVTDMIPAGCNLFNVNVNTDYKPI